MNIFLTNGWILLYWCNEGRLFGLNWLMNCEYLAFSWMPACVWVCLYHALTRNTMLVCWYRARATLIRCFCPPDRLMPCIKKGDLNCCKCEHSTSCLKNNIILAALPTRSPISVWSPCGRMSISGWREQASITALYLWDKNTNRIQLRMESSC